MTPYQEIIKQRKISRLCHFTKSSNLPFILGDGVFESNGILSTESVKKTKYLEILDTRRFDHKENYVCCSVQHINMAYFNRRKQKNSNDLFHEWAVLFIDPTIIDDTSLFSPVNAATGSGRYISDGPEAFNKIFEDELTWNSSAGKKHLVRPATKPANLPTNDQAEVLIKDKVPIEKIIGIGFFAPTYDVEVKRMSFWYPGKIKPCKLGDIPNGQ